MQIDYWGFDLSPTGQPPLHFIYSEAGKKIISYKKVSHFYWCCEVLYKVAITDY